MDQVASHSTTWAEHDFVQKTLATFRQQLQSDVAERWDGAARYTFLSTTIDSPLEIAFLAAWEMYRAVKFSYTGACFYLEAQVPVDHYRLDFQVRLCDDGVGKHVGRFPKLCIELDGHEFHEKTKAQVAYRNERDRHLMSQGWKVLRFSGSEFYRDPFGCVLAAWAFGDDAVGQLLIEDWRRAEGRA
jgi:very-short-patch-repair endonuclease